MLRKYTITLRDAHTPSADLVTKFGGQPVWLTGPKWPLSRSTGKPMRFLCQVALDEWTFGPLAGRMAYLFMTDEDDVVETFDPDGGENALIIQPGVYDGPVSTQATGPTLEKGVDRTDGTLRRDFFPVELAVELQPGEDPDSYPDVTAYDENAPDALAEIKVGGMPAWLQGEEYPSGGPWRLVIQLDSATDLYDVNFGDAGIGYAFISADGQRGRFLWQCA